VKREDRDGSILTYRVKIRGGGWRKLPQTSQQTGIPHVNHADWRMGIGNWPRGKINLEDNGKAFGA